MKWNWGFLLRNHFFIPCMLCKPKYGGFCTKNLKAKTDKYSEVGKSDLLQILF